MMTGPMGPLQDLFLGDRHKYNLSFMCVCRVVKFGMILLYAFE